MSLRQRHARDTSGAAHGDGARLSDALAQLEQLRGELARAHVALDSVPLGVLLFDQRGAVVIRNARTRTGSGHGDVLVQQAVDRLVPVALAGRDTHTSVELFGPPRKVIDVHAAPLIDGGAIVSIEDISERARLDAVRTDFVANISHELKTPVGALAVLAEAIADEGDLDVVQRLAGKMVDEAHRAASAIDDLLELSRIELGGKVYATRCVPPPCCTTRWCGRCRPPSNAASASRPLSRCRVARRCWATAASWFRQWPT